jgi:allantoate deiminase
MQINLARMMNDLENLRQYGKTADGGVSRHPFTEEDQKARAYLLQEAEKYGLKVRIDPVSSVIARYEGNKLNAPVIMMGSHYDTVINGGAYDGILGVITALEVLRVLSENKIVLEHPLEMIAFNDEEGSRFGKGFACSKAMTGRLFTKDIEESRDRNGVSLGQAMQAAGFDPSLVPLACRNASDLHAFVELHIEQGPVLEHAQEDIGIVTTIVGSCRYNINIFGRPDHAGTTPMEMRKDPLVAAAKVIAKIPEFAHLLDPQGVATVGFIQTRPGAANVVPATASFSLDVRSKIPGAARGVVERIFEELQLVCGSNLSYEAINLKSIQQETPVDMNTWIQHSIEKAAQKLGVKYRYMFSGAGHDAELIAELCPTGMIFVPSREGRSHSPLEYTKPEHIEKGAQVMLETVLNLDVTSISNSPQPMK